jgi:hypothetical protein
MFTNKIYSLVLLLMLILTSCIKRYDPLIKRTDEGKYVVTGGVNSGDSIQHITISVASLLSNKPRFIPVAYCVVKIIDGKGNFYTATDLFDGNYEVIIPESELVPGNTFKVDIQVPDGTHIISDFDQIQDCPEVYSVYYLWDMSITGIQFYVDLDASNFECRNYRFEAIETWEYSAPYAWVSAGSICWVSSNIRGVYTLSTKDLTENIYKLLPLNSVDNYSSQRLRYMYSLLVTQFSLSDAAFDYWDQMRRNNIEQGGLYENQPFQVTGNLHNLTDPAKQVLGFFGASTKKTNRIFVRGFGNAYADCPPGRYNLQSECVDCRNKVGGTNIKPAWWPY